ncbi:prefoldin subunit 6 isoform X2 [Phymastichus coffea]|nr:prefoldin subunit 6 isoform X2 [Phymastichus coffea]
MVEEIKKNLQEEIENFKQVQKDYHKTLSRRQQLDSQMNENITVKEELNLLKVENKVFKLIGPVLVRQDLDEAKENVNKRMEFIKIEIK